MLGYVHKRKYHSSKVTIYSNSLMACDVLLIGASTTVPKIVGDIA